MGGIGYDIPATPIEGRTADPAGLYRAVHAIVSKNIDLLAHGPATTAVMGNYMPEYGEKASLQAPLMFGFYDGGGGCMLSMEALCHWFVLITTALREVPKRKKISPLDALAEHHGMRLAPLARSLADELVAEGQARPLVELRGVLYEVATYEGDTCLSSDDRPDAIAMKDLTAEERALVEEIRATRVCRCRICAALRAGKKPTAPWVPKPPRDGLAGAVSRKKIIQIEGRADLSELPAEVLRAKSLKRLSLDGTSITTLPDALGDLAKLDSLSVRATPVLALPETVSKLHALRSFSLSDTGVASLAPLAGLPALTYVWLMRVPAAAVESLPCDRLPALRSLTISACGVVPRTLGEARALSSLSFDSNGLTTLPDDLARLERLEWLSLQSNALETLPEVVCALPALTSLNLWGNPLIALPASIARLSKLTYLGLAATKLTELPDAIGALTSLRMLQVYATPLARLPAALRDLASLEELFIGDTALGPPESWVDAVPRRLKVLRVSSSTPAADKAKLRKALPNTEIG